MWVLAILLVMAVLGTVVIGYVINKVGFGQMGQIGMSTTSHRDMLREVEIQPAATRNKIAIVDLVGIISGDPWDYLGNNLVTHIEDQLERAAEDDNVKAIILKIDSPGGEVMASDDIYRLLHDFQEEHEKPVIASMGSIAASGGYYVAAPCRWIVANELTITGSIGVIMHTYNWRGLMDKVGVSPQVFKSGRLKDMLSPDKRADEVTDEERKIVQDLVNETFGRFKQVVEEGRTSSRSQNQNEAEEADQGRALDQAWQDYADGRLLSGKDAWRLGFVDELGNFDTAVERAEKIAGIDEARLVRYLRPMGLGSLFRLFGQSEESRVKVDFGVRIPDVKSGLYFMAPQLVR